MAVATLIAFGLRQVIGGTPVVGTEVSDYVASVVKERFADCPQALPKALTKANNSAWQSLAIALGSEFVDQIRVLFSDGRHNGICQQVETFRVGQAGFGASPLILRSARSQLKQANSRGVLSADNLVVDDIAGQTARCRRLADPQDLIDASWQVVVRIADELAPDYHDLAALLRLRMPAGPPLLVSAFAYFFRLEAEADHELSNRLILDGLRQLSAAREEGFSALGKTLESLDAHLDAVIRDVNRIDKYVHAYLTRTKFLLGIGEFDRAIADCNEALRLKPGHAHAHCYRSECHRMKGDYNKGIIDSTAALRLATQLFSAYLIRGGCYRRKGEYDRAIADCTEALQHGVGRVFAYACRADCYRMKGEYDKAIADCNEALRLNSRYAHAYSYRGDCYRIKGDSNKAIADFDEAVRLNPDSAFARAQRASASQHQSVKT